ncbi:DIS3-like exonuclease 2 isoform X2 [Daphnia pulex]|uniref:DIS3-like exonuclease 2 isoform X2 n=1 Tax=Daphnia pulex TaxID=6669 RepID=UPI001EE015EF|nr:DIS3-like exonuclease 2 isoform X2 [Daphnia pulex]
MAKSIGKNSTPQRPNRSKTFENYWDQKDVEEGLRNESLFEGVLRINPKNYKEAYISAPDGTEDFLIEGILHRNRALNGDIVVCEMLPTQTANKECEKSFAESPSSPNIQQNEQPITPKNLAAASELKENISKVTEKEVQCVDADLAASREVRGAKTLGPKNRKKPKKLMENVSNLNLGAELQDKSGLKTPSTMAENLDNPAEEQRKRTRRPRKKKNVIVENLTAQLSASCTIEDSLTKTTTVQVETLSVVLQNKSHINTAGTIDENSQQNPNIVNTPRKIAKVVFIKELKHSRCAIGSLRQWPYGQSGPLPSWILFAPKDHRIPRLKIPFAPELASCLLQPNMLYLARIDSWEDVNHPLGSLCYFIGKSGDIEAETIALLLEHEVDYGDFPQEVFDDLPSLPWSIPTEEIKKRRDFRQQCIFTIDPADARDLDDAVSGRFLKMADDGITRLYRVSVHIADVSFFVQDNTVLDGIASRRATSTYLVDRVIPMLPSVLCEHVCSLNPGEDRLAFSVEWIVNDKGEILEEWFGRSIIRSCVKLSYDHAQAVIEDREIVNCPEIKGPYSVAEIRETILVLQELAGYLRKKRVDQGALRIDLPRLAFSMDWETRTPIGFRVYELKESNRLIEEFMLLANMRVAEKIYGVFPALAVLRSHPPPPGHKLEQLADTLQTIGIHLDVTSSATLQESLLRYGQGSSDPISMGRNLVISNLLAKPMKCASYICSGVVKKEEKFRHYALSVPFYTHFTSPIRRYPDILVHRLLDAALEQESLDHWEQSVVKRLLDNCNSRKLAAKALQETHSELHLANLIRKSGSIEVKGIVLAVLDHSVDVVLIYLGIIRRLYIEKLPLKMTHEKYNGIGKLTLVWDPESPGSQPTHQVISVFSLLEILLVPHAENDKLDFTLVLQRPNYVQ